MRAMSETDFINALQRGVGRTEDFIALLTDYHGGAVKTEYLITADIAREFVERHHEVHVECLYRRMISPMIALNGASSKKLGSRRADIAIMDNSIFPIAIIEVKIGANKFTRIAKDLDRITTVMNMMQARYASNVLGASVFQTYIAGSSKRNSFDQFKAATLKIEEKIEKNIAKYAQTKPGFSIKMKPLQPADSGIVAREIEDIEGESAWGQDGHATRYHAVIIRSNRPVPPQPHSIDELRKVGEK